MKIFIICNVLYRIFNKQSAYTLTNNKSLGFKINIMMEVIKQTTL